AMPDGAACKANQVLYNLGERGVEFDLIPWSQSYQMPIIAYSPIAEGRLLRNPVLLKIAEKHNVTAAQIALAWTIRLDGVMAIPKASSSAHVMDNFKALDIILDEDDRRVLDTTFPPPTKRIPLAGW
ncbi:MAG: aldo/keto reductase, partial [Muribaculaceae bacterium]|nr:aldo/keto reductase [Muribaculaceae bacterium]